MTSPKSLPNSLPPEGKEVNMIEIPPESQSPLPAAFIASSHKEDDMGLKENEQGHEVAHDPNGTLNKGKKRAGDDSEIPDRSKKILSHIDGPHFTSVAINDSSLLTPRMERLGLAVPPVQRTSSFSILNALLSCSDDLMLQVTRYLDVDSFVTLYCICKPFHMNVSSHMTTYITRSAAYNAPGSLQASPFFAYRKLCIADPVHRKVPSKPNMDKHVPSFRWLRMVTYRYNICAEILTHLALQGHRVPADTIYTLQRIWFLMDIGTNGCRVSLMRNTKYMTDGDIIRATLLFFKLDMFFSDPVFGTNQTRTRKLMLGQRSLTTLVEACRGSLSSFDMLKLYVKYDYQTTSREETKVPIFGIHPQLIGKGCLEGWGSGTNTLLRPDKLIMRESIRRQMKLHLYYIDFLLWGHMDTETKAAVEPVKVGDVVRNIEKNNVVSMDKVLSRGRTLQELWDNEQDEVELPQPITPTYGQGGPSNASTGHDTSNNVAPPA